MSTVTTATLSNLRFQNGILFSQALDLALRQGGIPLTTSCCTGLAAPTSGQVLAWNSTLNIYAPTTGGGAGIAANLTYTSSTTTGTIANTNGTGFVIPLGTATNSGLLSPTQFTQIANAQPLLVSATNIKTINSISLLGSGDILIAGGVTNLAIGAVSATTQAITNSNGTGFTLPAANSVYAGLLTAAQFTQLSLLPAGAIQVATSITGNGTIATPLKLVGDVTPTALQYYGTNGSSVLSYYNLPTGATAANLSYTVSPTTGTVANTNGTGFVIPLGTATNSGLLSPAQFTQIANAQPLLVSGTNIKTVGGVSLLGAGDVPFVLTNLAIGVVSGTTQAITNSNGTGFTLPPAGAATAGLLTSAQFTQLSLLPSGAIQSVNSITGTGTIALPLKLVGDTTPTASQYYGTNGASVLSYYNLPTTGGISRVFSGGADIKYFVSSGTPVVTFAKSGGVGTISVSGGTIELSRVQVDVVAADLSGDAFALIAPIVNSGAFLQYPSVTKINRQLGGAPGPGVEHIYSISNTPGVQVNLGTAGTTISVKVINVSSMNTTATFVYNF